MKKRTLGLFAALGGIALSAMACNGQNEAEADLATLSQSNHQMINGTLDTTEAHKAVVSLFLDYGSSSQSSCTGTLIHPQWVITASHCVTDKSYNGTITASSYNRYYKIGIGNNVSELKANLYDIEKIYYHEKYNPHYIDNDYYTIDNDIALIKLAQPIDESIVKPLHVLPPWLGISLDQINEDGVKVEFVGYGADDEGVYGLKKAFSANLTSYCGGNANADGCKLGGVEVNGCHPDTSYCNSWSYYYYCTNGHFCLNNYTDYVWLPFGSLYYEQDDGGPCQGDSGGPAFVTIGGVEYVAGLTSYGDAACAKTGISTATQDHYSWILSKAPEIAETFVEVCGNGIDDDNNGIIDDDALCAPEAPEEEIAE